MTRLAPDELKNLQRRAYALVLELRLATEGNYYLGLLPLRVGGEHMVLTINRGGARVVSAARTEIVRFPGLEAAGILQWLRNLAERRDAERLAKTLA